MNMRVFIVSNDVEYPVCRDAIPSVGDRVRWFDWNADDHTEHTGTVMSREFDYTNACIYLYVEET